MLRLFSIFITLCLISLLISLLGFNLKYENYWHHHGVFLLISLSLFPRLTLLVSSIPFGGLFWWTGFFFFPRYLIAILSTINYWHKNPLLVTIAWFIAVGGESTEKYYIKRRVYYTKKRYPKEEDVIDVEALNN